MLLAQVSHEAVGRKPAEAMQAETWTRSPEKSQSHTWLLAGILRFSPQMPLHGETWVC